MSVQTTITTFFCLLVGVLIGRWSVSPDISKSSRAGAGVAEGESEVADVDASSSSLLEPLSRFSGLREPVANGNLVVVPASLLQRDRDVKSIISLDQELFRQGDVVEKYLQISEEEKRALQQEWRLLQRRVRLLESKSSNSEDLADGSVKITLPVMKDEMRQIYDEFMAITGSILDPNRTQVFLSMKGVEAAITHNTGERSYIVDVDETGNGRWRYKMTVKDEDGLSKTWIGESIPSAIRHLTDTAGIHSNLNPPEKENE